MPTSEINFDGLVGPTHNYAGLSYGNTASAKHKALTANPREAALQGLAKMKRLHDLGFKQAVLPPQERPALWILRALGFSGSDAEILAKAWREARELVIACSSSASMWTANAATTSPSADTADARVHFTPANLSNKFHRAIEAPVTARILKAIFPDETRFRHHPPLPQGDFFGDEGAANHTRLCADYGSPGLEFFVYGKRAFSENGPRPEVFPARQSLEACQAVARAHALDPDRVFFARQNPDAIDAGAFHNDVVAVGNRGFLFCHERAFFGQDAVLDGLREKYAHLTGAALDVLVVRENEVPLADAISSYLFNTQLLSRPDGAMLLVAPAECSEVPSVKFYLDKLLSDGRTPIRAVEHVDVRQSMRNGGGPACLRLRVALAAEEERAANPGVFFDGALHDELAGWVKRHYRDRLALDDLADPLLLDECRRALDELTRLLGLGPVYPFQG